MNAHSRQLGSATPNSAGSHIDELVRPRGSSSFFLADTGPAFTRPSPRGSGGSIIDLVFGANSNLSGGHCYDGVDWTSDHRPISCTVSPQSPRSDDSTNYLRIRLEELDVPETRSAYVSAIQLAQPALDDRIRAMAFCASPTSTVTEKLALVDAMELDFTSTVLSIAKTVLGTKRVPVLPSGPQSRPSPEYIQAFSELQSVYQALRQRPQLAEPLLTERDRLKIKVRSIALRDRTRAYRDWLQNTGSLSAVQVMKIVQRIRRTKAAAGASLASTPIALDSYREHFAQQFQNSFITSPFIPNRASPSLLLGQDIFQKDYIAQCISFSRDGKAPGITGLTTDLLRPASITLSVTLELMFTTYFMLGVVPRSWTRALICPVPKKGDLRIISNYRPISLTETGRKLFELCLLRHLQPLTPLSREQGGFRSARSTIDHVETLDKLIRHTKRQHRRHPEMAFLDIKAAYDSVPRAVLWRRCIAIGYSSATLCCLCSLFDHNSAQLVLKQKRSRPFSQPAGVLQGSVLSPLLYSIYIDPLVETLRTGPKIEFSNGHSINCLLYADDIVIIARDPTSLRQLLLLAEADSISRGYRFSPTKCVTLSQQLHNQQLYDSVLPIESHFNYLGVEINCSGIDEALHVKNRVDKLNKQADLLASIGARYLGFPRQCSIRLYKSFLRPGLEYGISLITRNKLNLASLEKAQKQALCRILGLHKNSHSVTTLAVTCCPDMSVRRACLDLSRQKRLAHIFNLVNHCDFALPYVSIGLNEPLPVLPVITRSELLESIHFDPLRAAIISRFHNTISMSDLLLPLSHDIPWRDSRMLVLWLFRKFDCFDKSRLCHVCSSPIRTQTHVSFCGAINAQLVHDLRFPSLPAELPTSILPVELTLAHISAFTPIQRHSLIRAISEIILNAVNSVFGLANANSFST
jgi:hypothetical protein